MKRSAAILVLALYGILSIGVHIHLHYCCGKLAGMELVSKQHGCCQEAANKDCTISHQCCSYTQLDFAIEDEHYSASFHYLLPIACEETSSSLELLFDASSTIVYTAPHDLAVKRRLFLEHTSLIYYA